jgi:DNA topoisomerase-1
LGGPVTVHAGRYGPYVKHGAVNATLPKSLPPETVSLDAAVALIAEKAGKSPPPKARSSRSAATKPAAKAAKPKTEAAPKKAAAKKSAAKSAPAGKRASAKRAGGE